MSEGGNACHTAWRKFKVFVTAQKNECIRLRRDIHLIQAGGRQRRMQKFCQTCPKTVWKTILTSASVWVGKNANLTPLFSSTPMVMLFLAVLLIDQSVKKKVHQEKNVPVIALFLTHIGTCCTGYVLCVSQVSSLKRIAKCRKKIRMSAEATNEWNKGNFRRAVSLQRYHWKWIVEWRMENMAPGKAAARCSGTQCVSPISTLV